MICPLYRLPPHVNLIDIIAYFSFFVSLMGFMRLVDVVKYMSDKITDDNANHEANQ